ncbi:MAG TPA: DUF1203 domain-containing protein [Sphingomicrobium sp.]|nr:DUF1203 domain-containing protein [Sphingomicrobium sp.]
MTFVVRGLNPAPFEPLFGLSGKELSDRGVFRLLVSSKPNFPCRVGLADCDVGEKVLLLNHVSHDVANPYRASHAIFVREGACEQAWYHDEIPPVFAHRILSLRGFDAGGMMVEAALAQAGNADAEIRKLLANQKIATIHAHNAIRGCFAAKIERS